MKMTKADLISKINERVTDIDMAIELIEDITDSMEEMPNDAVDNESLERITSLESELLDLKNKYKERFMQGVDEIKDTDNEDIEELKEETLIDVKEI